MSKKVIDHFTSSTGWVLTGSGTTITELTNSDYIAGLNSKSLMIKFSSADVTRKAVKTFTAIDTTGYKSLVISTWSHDFKRDKYLAASQFSYKIKINSSNEFYLPCGSNFGDWSIGIEGITSIDRIEITPTHSETDYIIISECVVEDEDIIFDVLSETKENIEYILNSMYGNGTLIKSGFTGTAGDERISISSTIPYAEKYAVIKIVQGGTSETHQLDDTDEITFLMNKNYDGKSLLNTYTNASVYLTYPVRVSPGQLDINLPGVAVWGFDPEPFLRGAKQDHQYDTFTATGIKGRKEGQLLRHNIQIDLEAHHEEMIDNMSKAIRKMIAKHSLWVNGRKHEIMFNGAPVIQTGSPVVDIIPKMTWNVIVESQESLYDRESFPLALASDITVEVQ